ncbi:MAG: DUF4407 domain-containing protein [bacterium]
MKIFNKIKELISKFLIFCSGADKKILQDLSIEQNRNSEQTKMVGVGATVFFTAVFAFFSCSYAMYKVFNNDGAVSLFLVILIGLIWALMIFNLDRYIVSSMPKSGNIKKQIRMAIPRYILAIFIGLVISEPIVVKLFEDRIKAQINENFLKDINEKNKVIEWNVGLPTIKKDYSTLIKTKNELDSLIKEEPQTSLYDELLKERISIENGLQVIKNRNNALIEKKIRERNAINYRPNDKRNLSIISNIQRLEGKEQNDAKTKYDITEAQEAQYTRIQNEIRALRQPIYDLESKLSKVNEKINNEIAIYQKDILKKADITSVDIDNIKVKKSKAERDLDIYKEKSKIINEKSFSENFITQIEALNSLTKNNTSMLLVYIFIVLLFIIIESAPVSVKLLSPEGTYDFIHKRNEESTKNASEGITHSRLAFNNDNNKQILESEIITNKIILEKISEAQLQLAEKEVIKWKNEEMKNYEKS